MSCKPIIIQLYNYNVQSVGKCTVHKGRWPDLPWGAQKGLQRKHASWGLRCTKRPGRNTVPLAVGRGAPAAPRNKDILEEWRKHGQRRMRQVICKMEIKRRHWRRGMGSTRTDFIPGTLGSLWKVLVREGHDHIYSFKISPRGAFPSPLPLVHACFLKAPCSLCRALSHSTAIVCFPVWTNWNSYLSF